LCGGDAGERFAEPRNVRGGKRETYGVGVASEAREERVVALFVRVGEGVEEMEAGDGAARAVGCAVFMREDECGTMGALDDARGEDADDAAVPTGVGCRGFGGP